MHEEALNTLKEYFGYSTFKPMQEKIIHRILQKQDSLVILPTGGGKSLCYQVPALMFKGLTLVISPLISLMKDQVSQLHELGIPSAYLNSSLSREDYSKVLDQLRANSVRLIYVAPETLLKKSLQAFLQKLSVDCIAVDEAHCISQWGPEFRPEYRKIVSVKYLWPQAVTLALTATATEQVRKDILECLQMPEEGVFLTSFDRPNLFIEVKKKRYPYDQTLDFLRKRKADSGIIYCLSRRAVDSLAGKLRAEGFSVFPYHAGLTRSERALHQEAFLSGNIKIMVATIAFGMGINKGDVRYILHYDLPKNIESYYQQIGRAGRDGKPAYCLALFSKRDIRRIQFFIDKIEDFVYRHKVFMELDRMVDFMEVEECRRKFLLRYFNEAYKKENCGNCDICLSGDVSLENPLFQKLKSVRLKEAKTLGIPAYRVLGDKSLLDLVRKKPKNYEEFLGIQGIGPQKARKYASIFLPLIKKAGTA